MRLATRHAGSLQRCRLTKGCYQSRCISTGYISPSVLTNLHKTRALLVRILPPTSTAGPEQSLELWNQVLTASTPQTDVTIAVLEADEWSSGKELVTALLREPFASDASSHEYIASRWANRSSPSIRIRQDAQGDFQCSSSYLRQFPVPIEIQELPSPPKSTPESLSFLQDKLTLDAFLRADIPLLVINPLTTSPASVCRIRNLIQNPNTILVFTHASSSSADLAALHARYGDAIRGLNVIFADPHLALEALDTLNADPTSQTAVQRYQDNFVRSGVSSVWRAVQQSIQSTGQSTPKDILLSLQEQTSAAQLRTVLRVAGSQLKHEQSESDAQLLRTSKLRERVEEERVRTHAEIFNQDTMAHIETKARKTIQAELQKFTWWKMVGRVDDITSVVSAIVASSMGAIEKQLVYNTGKLSAIQKQYSTQTLGALPKPGTSLHSSVLRNELEQLMASPSYAIGPSVFLGPLATRKEQIIRYPTARLHIAGQRSVLGMSGSAVTGLALSWAGWVEWLMPSFVSMDDASTLMGAGGLISVLGLRWAVGHWEKAKKRWWDDWKRIYDGLERDLKKTSDSVMREQALVVADRGCTALHKAIEERNREIEELSDEIAVLESGSSEYAAPRQG